MPELTAWTCPSCAAEVGAESLVCSCGTVRYATFAIMLAHHVTEHLADGLDEPLEILEALTARGVKAYRSLTLSDVAQQMRLLTKDTTALARQIAKARASRVMLDVLETGDTKDKLAVLKGIQVLGDVVEQKIDSVTRHVVELYEGPPPERKG